MASKTKKQNPLVRNASIAYVFFILITIKLSDAVRYLETFGDIGKAAGFLVFLVYIAFAILFFKKATYFYNKEKKS